MWPLICQQLLCAVLLAAPAAASRHQLVLSHRPADLRLQRACGCTLESAAPHMHVCNVEQTPGPQPQPSPVFLSVETQSSVGDMKESVCLCGHSEDAVPPLTPAVPVLCCSYCNALGWRDGANARGHIWGEFSP